jgi:hypothetical protein
MALITCGECRRSISDAATACPGCGCPVRKTPAAQPVKTKPSQRNALIAMVAAAGLTGALYWYRPDLPWWAYVLGGLLSLGAIGQGLNETQATEKVLDRL